MTIPFDTSPPTTRPFPVTFNTDQLNLDWLKDMTTETDLDRSLIVHRIVEEARKAATAAGPDRERRNGDRRSA